MKNVFLYGLVLVITLIAGGPASAACYADYKAKRDNPLRLHYGVVELQAADCSNPAQAKRMVATKLLGTGWTLLNVVSVFDETELGGKRKSAGEYFLRY